MKFVALTVLENIIVHWSDIDLPVRWAQAHRQRQSYHLRNWFGRDNECWCWCTCRPYTLSKRGVYAKRGEPWWIRSVSL